MEPNILLFTGEFCLSWLSSFTWDVSGLQSSGGCFSVEWMLHLNAYLDNADGKAYKMVLDHGHTAGELVLMVMEMVLMAAKRLGLCWAG